MKSILRNILAVVVGIIVGMMVNGGLIELGYKIVPLEGFDTSTMEGLKEAMAHFSPKNYIFPFLAHAVGTLVGALLAAAIAATHKMKFALAIGFIFLIAGTVMVLQVPSPIWFNVIDLTLAYIPMAWIGGKIGVKFSKK